FLDKVTARSDLGPEEREALLSLPATPRRIDAHREIVHLGEHVEHACLVAEGYVARFAQMEDGRRQNVSLHIPGDMVDLYSLTLPAVPTPLAALTATTVFQVPHAVLRELAFRYPQIAAAFWRECVVDGNIIKQWLVSVGRRDARGRLAHLLCEMAVRSERIGRFASGRYPFPITQEQIADALGLTPVHVNRTLQAMRAEGLIQIANRDVAILDWDALVSAGEFDPTYLHLPDKADTGQQALAH
ncbi:Crp/Fnr family transcriptional regulator, partial [Sphingomonas sp.]|uniref:Crp/Fnr family transcriptional regulator n=1 Tax=Sphingomonas sp. TaxID=28214 RepID=UPI003B3AD88F